jgi:hypothetical protein
MSAPYEAIFPSLRTPKLAYPPPPAFQSTASESSGAAPDGDSFAHDVMEILNPLQHFPIVSTIYRQMTGDKIGPMERIAGDTLYGGVLGLASSVANIAFEQLTGKDFGDTALAMLGIGDDKATAMAANGTAAQPAASRAATAAPAPLIPVTAKTMSATSVQPGTPAIVDNSNISVLMNSLNRNGAGLGLEQPAPSTVATSALDDNNSSASLASLNRGGLGLEPAAWPTAPTTLPPVATSSQLSDANASALMASLNRDGIGTDMGLRAMYAYRKTLSLPASAADATQH